MADSKLGYRVWALAIYLLTTGLKGTSSMKLHRDLGVTQKAAWHLAHRIREAWHSKPELFAGPVEVDECYLGGKERNKHWDKKTNAGRGPVGKVAVVGAKDRRANRVAAAPVERTTKASLQGFVRGTVADGGQIYSDQAGAYAGMPEYRRETVKHSVGEYVRLMAHINGIESFWSLLKRGYWDSGSSPAAACATSRSGAGAGWPCRAGRRACSSAPRATSGSAGTRRCRCATCTCARITRAS